MTNDQLNLQTTTTLSNGVQMPVFGLGVFKMTDGREVSHAVEWALEAGYRGIDTARIYANEEGVGRAIRESEVAREDLFVTTKVWNTDQGYDTTLRAFDVSLKRLGVDYIDLYLVHWPVKGKYKETWKALEALYRDGRTRAIGVSNFMVHHLRDLLEDVTIVPMVNQVECHPRLQQPPLQAFCRDHDIQLEAWSPIMKGRVMDIPELQAIGRKFGKSPVQVTLRWLLQKGIVVIPKSSRQERIVSNADVFDFTLEETDMARIDDLDQGVRVGPDPDNFHF